MQRVLQGSLLHSTGGMPDAVFNLLFFMITVGKYTTKMVTVLPLTDFSYDTLREIRELKLTKIAKGKSSFFIFLINNVHAY